MVCGSDTILLQTGVNEIRMAYVINEKDITRCMELLKKGIEAYLEAN